MVTISIHDNRKALKIVFAAKHRADRVAFFGIPECLHSIKIYSYLVFKRKILLTIPSPNKSPVDPCTAKVNSTSQSRERQG